MLVEILKLQEYAQDDSYIQEGVMDRKNKHLSNVLLF